MYDAMSFSMHLERKICKNVVNEHRGVSLDKVTKMGPQVLLRQSQTVYPMMGILTTGKKKYILHLKFSS